MDNNGHSMQSLQSSSSIQPPPPPPPIMNASSSSQRIMRVSQMDAHVLDTELNGMIQQQWDHIFEYWNVRLIILFIIIY